MQETTILFQGDSLTDGNRYKLESQRWDLNHQIGHAYPYIVASLLGSSAPGRGFRFINRGVGGDTVRRMQDRWQTDTLACRPDILSVLIGVNDVCGLGKEESASNAERFEEIYRSLLDQAQQENPKIRFVLIEPMLLKAGPLNEEWLERCRRMPAYQEAVQRIARDHEAVFIPTQALFNSLCSHREASYWVWDGVHPTEAGHGIIARQWLKATGLWETAIDDCASNDQ